MPWDLSCPVRPATNSSDSTPFTIDADWAPVAKAWGNLVVTMDKETAPHKIQ